MSTNRSFQDKIIRFIRVNDNYLVVGKDILDGTNATRELTLIEDKSQIREMKLKLDTKTRNYNVLTEAGAVEYLTKKPRLELLRFIQSTFAELRAPKVELYLCNYTWLSLQLEKYIWNKVALPDLRILTSPNKHELAAQAQLLLPDANLNQRWNMLNTYFIDWIGAVYPFSVDDPNVTRTFGVGGTLRQLVFKSIPECPYIPGKEDPVIQIGKNHVLATGNLQNLPTWPLLPTWNLISVNRVNGDENMGPRVRYIYQTEDGKAINVTV